VYEIQTISSELVLATTDPMTHLSTMMWKLDLHSKDCNVISNQCKTHLFQIHDDNQPDNYVYLLLNYQHIYLINLFTGLTTYVKEVYIDDLCRYNSKWNITYLDSLIYKLDCNNGIYYTGTLESHYSRLLHFIKTHAYQQQNNNSTNDFDIGVVLGLITIVIAICMQQMYHFFSQAKF
jgi:hypothetical protein